MYHKVEVTEAELNQEDINAATEEHLTEGAKPKKAKKAVKKAKKASTKRPAIELSSDSDETDFHDMDVDYDPEVTMAAMGPPQEAGPKTRSRRTVTKKN